jgi:transcriptional regulator with XRE-family HTH domain
MNISIERSRRGWSRAELARRAGLNTSTVGLIESGRLRPYESQLLKLANALGVSRSEAHLLLEDTPAPESTAPLGTGQVGRAT